MPDPSKLASREIITQAWQLRDFIASGHQSTSLIHQTTREVIQHLTRNTFRPARVLSSAKSAREKRARSRSSSLDPLAQSTWPENWAIDRTSLRKAIRSFETATVKLRDPPSTGNTPVAGRSPSQSATPLSTPETAGDPPLLQLDLPHPLQSPPRYPSSPTPSSPTSPVLRHSTTVDQPEDTRELSLLQTDLPGLRLSNENPLPRHPSSPNPSNPNTPITPQERGRRKEKKIHAKIRPFRGLRDGKEDPQEYVEDIEFAYDQEGHDEGVPVAVAEKLYRLLFRQNLEDDAWTWYTDLERDIKQNWQRLRARFLASYEITEKDAQAKKFDLRIKVAQLKQSDREDIAEYLKRAGDLARKMPDDEIDIGMATLRGMDDQHKRSQVNFECNKGQDYSYPTVEKLIKAAYSEIGKPNPFDPVDRRRRRLLDKLG